MHKYHIFTRLYCYITCEKKLYIVLYEKKKNRGTIFINFNSARYCKNDLNT